MKFFLLAIALLGLYSQLLCQDLKSTDKEALFEVLVVDFNDNGKVGEQIIFEGIETKKSFKGVSDASGKFNILLPGGETYLIKLKSVGNAKDYNKITIPALEEGYIYNNNKITIKFETPKIFTLDNVYFDSGKATLRKDSYPELKELSEYMKLKKSLIIEIAGHTDNVGEEDNNLTLSQDRANTVRTYLIKNGIDANRVQAKGYGESQPIDTNETDLGRQHNRRTEVRVIEE